MSTFSDVLPCCIPLCLQGEPLRKYFYGLYSQAELNAFEANMFLAEDRILCIEVVAKKVRAAPRFVWRRLLHATCICSMLLASASSHCASAQPPLHPSLPQGANYRLEYIKEAVAEADAVTKLTGLMKQRRRWLNGTFFAMLYALGNMGRIWTESSHSVLRKMVLTAEFFYLLVNLIIGTWCVTQGGWGSSPDLPTR